MRLRKWSEQNRRWPRSRVVPWLPVSRFRLRSSHRRPCHRALGRRTRPPHRCGAGAAAVAAPEPPSDWATREALSGDWGGARSALKERGIVVKPRLTQFVQGLSAGDGEHGYEYGGKADLFVAADLGKLGFWNGFSMTLQADVNFGRNVNGRGGVLIPVNAALNAPGMEGSDAFDLSSAYFRQDFSDDVSLIFGKVNMIELVSAKPFMGGAGIDSFWNQSFVATPTGTVPPYLFGALMSVFTEPATYRLWVYDPNSAVNKNIGDAFDGGVSVRGSVDFNVRLGGLRGHQGFTAFYGTQKGADLESLDDVFLPTPEPRRHHLQGQALVRRLLVRPVCLPTCRAPRRRLRACSATSASRTATPTHCAGRCSSASAAAA